MYFSDGIWFGTLYLRISNESVVSLMVFRERWLLSLVGLMSGGVGVQGFGDPLVFLKLYIKNH